MIAILGATGQIGRSLARRLSAVETRPVTLFARAPERLETTPWPAHVHVAPLDGFDAGRFSLVVNALGAGDPGRVAAFGVELFDFTRRWDERVLSRLSPNGRYVFLSSGAVYGASEAGASADSILALPLNRLEQLPAYTASKLHCELRHRFSPDRAILDLRVFGFAPEPLDITGTSFLSNLACAVSTGAPFVTSSADMVRDYAGPEELWAMIQAWENGGAPNRPLDLYTRSPVSKHALLRAAQTRFGLDVRCANSDSVGSPTGAKPVYASTVHAAAELGYAPRRDALTVVLDALAALRADRTAHAA